MKTAAIRRKVVEEVNQIPDEKLPQIFEIIHRFRIGLQTSVKRPHKISNYAGCWKDMSDEMYDEYIDEIKQRRHTAFSRRLNREANID